MKLEHILVKSSECMLKGFQQLLCVSSVLHGGCGEFAFDS